jgi:hypothetical protein
MKLACTIHAHIFMLLGRLFDAGVGPVLPFGPFVEPACLSACLPVVLVTSVAMAGLCGLVTVLDWGGWCFEVLPL